MAYLSSLVEFLTKIYLKILHGGLTRTEKYSAHGITKKVYWFRSDSNIAGQSTPFNTIIMNEKLLEDYSEDAKDFIFLHEYGHSKLGPVKTILLHLVLLPTVLAAFVSLLLPITAVFLYIMTESVIVASVGFIIYVIIGVISSIIFSLPNRLEELRAEKFAIDRIGLENYKEVVEERREKSKRGLMDKVEVAILYPPERLVIWLYPYL